MKRLVAAMMVAVGLCAFGAAAEATTVDFVAKGTVTVAGVPAGGTAPLDSGDEVEFHLTYDTPASDTDSDPNRGAYKPFSRFDVTFKGTTYTLPVTTASASVFNASTDVLQFKYQGGPSDFIAGTDLGFRDTTGAAFGDDSLPGLLSFQSLSGQFGFFLVPPGTAFPVIINGVINSVTAVATTPIPAALPLLLSALGGLGFAGWRRRRAAA